MRAAGKSWKTLHFSWLPSMVRSPMVTSGAKMLVYGMPSIRAAELNDDLALAVRSGNTRLAVHFAGHHRDLLQLPPGLPLVAPLAVAQHVADVVVSDRMPVIARQQILPVIIIFFPIPEFAPCGFMLFQLTVLADHGVTMG